MMYFLLLFSSLLFATTSQVESVRFKIHPKAYNSSDPIQKEIYIEWYGYLFGQTRQQNDHVILKIELRSDKFDDVWLWQTYNVFQPDEIIWVEPKLPAKCVCFDVRYIFNSERFNIQALFQGKGCKGLKKLVQTQKILISYKGITVNEENRKIEQVDFIIDDLPEYVREYLP